MKNINLGIILLLFFIPLNLEGQFLPSSGIDGCNNSPVYCNLNVLQDEQGTLSNTTASTICPFTCGIGFTCNNNIWFSFVATSNTATITVNPFNCTESFSDFFGIQGQVFQISDCSDPQGFIPISNCFSGGSESSDPAAFDLNIVGMVPNEIYTVLLDGFAGSVCEFELEVTPSPPNEILELQNLSGPLEFCKESPVTYCVDLNPSIPMVEDYSFSISGVGSILDVPYLSENQNQVCIDILSPTFGNSTIQVSGNDGCNATENLSLTVTATALSTSTQFDTICLNQNETFLWENYLIESAGSYDVNLDSYFGCDSTLILEVLDLPIGLYHPLISGLEVEFVNMSQYGETYIWDFGDGNFSTLENPTHTYEEIGLYDITLSVTGRCGTTSYINTILFTNTDNIDISEQVNIFPNPSNGEFTVDWSGLNLNPDVIKIYNSAGIEIDQHLVKENENVGVNLLDTPTGLYYIELRSTKHTIIKKIILE